MKKILLVIETLHEWSQVPDGYWIIWWPILSGVCIFGVAALAYFG